MHHHVMMSDKGVAERAFVSVRVFSFLPDVLLLVFRLNCDLSRIAHPPLIAPVFDLDSGYCRIGANV